MRLLITGFEPFGGSDVNPSEHAARTLEASPPPGTEAVSAVLPCVDRACERALLASVREVSPDAVIALGEHGRETGLAFERFAINLRDYRLPDNDDNEVRDAPVITGGPAGCFTTLPVEEMAEASRSAGVPARVSRDAGTFLCNQAYYALLHARETRAITCPSVFVHVPCLPQQVASTGVPRPSMSTETVVRGLHAAIGVLRSGGFGA
ncbi:MAG: pyroglutamyl-peptidase I [Planctomycetota bacterium]